MQPPSPLPTSHLPPGPPALPAAPASQLHKTLGLTSLVFYGTGSMLGAGIYGLVGRVAGVMGSAVWLAFALAMVAALLTGLSYACLVSRHPRAAGASYITGRAFRSPAVAYIVGICVMASGLTSMATASNVFGANFVALPGLTWLAQHNGATWIAIAVIVLMGLLNFWGLRESAAVNTLCTVIEASGLLIIIALGISSWGSRPLLDLPPLPTTSPSGDPATRTFLALGVLMFQGAVLTFFSYIGFEDLLNVSEEARDAERTVPLALVFSQIITAVIYMAVAITAVSVLPWRELAASQTPLVDVARRAADWFPSWLIAVITCFAVLNTSLLNYIMGSRLVYGMSREGLLPAWLGQLHPARRTPWVAIVALGLIVLSLRLVGDISQTAAATVILLLVVFVAMNISLVILKLRPAEPKGQFEIPLLIPVLGALVCTGLIIARLTTPNSKPSLYIAGGIIGASAVLYLAMNARKPRPATTEPATARE